MCFGAVVAVVEAINWDRWFARTTCHILCWLDVAVIAVVAVVEAIAAVAVVAAVVEALTGTGGSREPPGPHCVG